jgi:hypothetical protein
MAWDGETSGRVTFRHLQSHRIPAQASARRLQVDRNRIVNQRFDAGGPQMLGKPVSLVATKHEQVVDMA